MAKDRKAEQVNNNEETINTVIKDCKRKIGKIDKGIEAMSELGNSESIQTAKKEMQNERIKVGNYAAKKVFVYLTGVQPADPGKTEQK